ncbi:hypothetical protein [Alteribacillus iranensis]|uniref:Uncharacterized protein n=1 Tax=Alteribacillus iranensis TaxID=930128 RepID=A0A1I2BSF1_9BACI|nr:hypothetical protein [Alteribacillus iranensis]SFE58828.1 hypothetical protein SAMN05192532_102471 [Alteribacillus iranensis]
MEEKRVSWKEIIFEDRKYSITKKALVLLFVLTTWLVQMSEMKEWIGITLVFSATVLGVIYSISKLFLYPAAKRYKDILLVIAFIGLFCWGLFTFYL